MAIKASFVRLEKALLPDFRFELSHAKTNAEIMNCFSKTTETLLEMAMDNDMALDDDDILLSPNQGCKYTISKQLMDEPVVQELMTHSDMPNILNRFAEAAEHRYMQKMKIGTRSGQKIREGVMR